MTHYSTEIAIVGGGVCGLWLLNILRNAGYEACLFEQGQLGQSQTLASQGMIHGGIKYALGGFTTPASETIASMPAKWQDCIAGTGSLDLRGLEVLSPDYYLFSDGALTDRVTAFFASKSLRGRVSAIKREHYPEAFQSSAFKGSLYRLQDMVIDTSALMAKLQQKYAEFIYQATAIVKSEDGAVVELQLDNSNSISAKRYIFAAGEGNGKLLSDLDFMPLKMQVRPLKQVLVKGQLPKIFAHAVSLKDANKPRLTITTHSMNDGDQVWYLGGNLAEQGVGMKDADLIAKARHELQALVPWVDHAGLEFRTLDINRAEPAQENQGRPDFPFTSQTANALVCWPTKLTLTPMLADEVLKLMAPPSGGDWQRPELPLATVSPPPWELAFA
ncbi:MAG: glycerol-3-phosphate dehydrogenase [Candidatus Azotimanducaceae bacterium]|jgi:glycerol-3-phosphate dehydrogenase